MVVDTVVCARWKGWWPVGVVTEKAPGKATGMDLHWRWYLATIRQLLCFHYATIMRLLCYYQATV
jgi:hypothetical protein